jgi:hypothetical protein
MHELLIDLQLVKRVWQDIEAHDDVRLAERKNEIRTNCKELLDKCLAEGTQPSLADVAAAAALPQAQLAEQSSQVMFDVLAFVGSACSFYDGVRGYRPLTQEEQEIGKLLALLTKQVQTIVPTSGS